MRTGGVEWLVRRLGRLARKRGVSASRVHLPLSFSSQLDGVCTLIGKRWNERGEKGEGAVRLVRVIRVIAVGLIPVIRPG